MSLPSKIVLKKRPKEYLKQGLTYCGGYTIKGVLSAFGMDDKKHPKEYQSGLPFGIHSAKTISNALSRYKINAEILSAKGHSDQQKIGLLKKQLEKGNPVILRIGNGYLKSGKYSRLRGFLVGHWISLWGFDDNKKEFYIYDSARLREDNLPIGNVNRSYSTLIRDWHYGNRVGFGHGSFTYLPCQRIRGNNP